MTAGSVGNHLRSHVVGYVAIFLALTGTAVALPGKNTVDSGDIRNGQVKPSDLSAKAAGPTAFGRIVGATSPNTVDESLSKGLADANVTRQGAGVYCIDGLSFEPRHMQVTMEYPANGVGVEPVATTAPTGDCPGDEQAMVYVDADGNQGTFAGIDTVIYLTLWK
jgi:hypothetical protein